MINLQITPLTARMINLLADNSSYSDQLGDNSPYSKNDHLTDNSSYNKNDQVTNKEL